jgi:hypothetical protein
VGNDAKGEGFPFSPETITGDAGYRRVAVMTAYDDKVCGVLRYPMKDHWQATCHPLNVLLEKDGCLAYQPMVVAVDINVGGAGG